MGLSLPAVIAVQTADIVAPKRPVFGDVVQENNKHIACNVVLPDQDANGEPLTGLELLYVAIAPVVGGVNPFDGLSSQEILDLPEVRTVTVDIETGNAGEEIAVDLPIVDLGQEHAIAAICSDAE